jgi:predicted DNA binding protein
MRAVELHLIPENNAFPGIDEAIRDLDGIQRETMMNFEWHSDETYTLVYRLSGDATEELDDLLDSHDQVRSYDVMTEDDRIYVFVHLTARETLSQLLEIAETHQLLLETPFQFTQHGVRVTVAGEESELQTAYSKGMDAMEIEVESTGVYQPDEPDFVEQMTDRQYEALVTAFDLGYYETPRTVSFEEVADALDCAPSTANELLRRAEAALVSSMLAR